MIVSQVCTDLKGPITNTETLLNVSLSRCYVLCLSRTVLREWLCQQCQLYVARPLAGSWCELFHLWCSENPGLQERRETSLPNDVKWLRVDQGIGGLTPRPLQLVWWSILGLDAEPRVWVSEWITLLIRKWYLIYQFEESVDLKTLMDGKKFSSSPLRIHKEKKCVLFLAFWNGVNGDFCSFPS